MADSLASLRGRIAGLANASRNDPRVYTAKARSRFLDKFVSEVDPDGALPPAERARRAQAARRLYFTRLALKSAKSRRKSREGHPRNQNTATPGGHPPIKRD